MRARSIKPGICDNEILGTADPLYTLLFERLWMIADRKGRLEDRPLRIKAQAFPYREGLDADAMLDWLATKGFIMRYVAGDSKYIQILAFSKHQSPHKNEQESVIPGMDEQSTAKVVRPENQGSAMDALTPSSLTADSGLLTADCGSLTAGNVPAPVDSWEFWTRFVAPEYPRGLWTESEGINASKAIDVLLESGTPAAAIIDAATGYRLQQEACGEIGTKFITWPGKFYSTGKWKGPFPLPAMSQKPKSESAMDRIKRLNPLPEDRLIEGEVLNG